MKYFAYLKPTFTTVFLGGILFIIASFIIFISGMMLYDSYSNSFVEEQKLAIYPVILALENYKEDNGNYIQKLYLLDDRRYIEKIPSVRIGGLQYSSSDEYYVLWFTVNPLFSSLECYHSATQQWVRSGDECRGDKIP